MEKTYSWKDLKQIFDISEDRNTFVSNSEKGVIPKYHRGKNNYRVWDLKDLPDIGRVYSRDTVFSKRAEKAPVINIYVSKGGGSHKTTTTFNLAGNLAINGLKVLVIDLDFQMNITKKLGIDNLRSTIESGGYFYEGLAEVLINGNKGIEEVICSTTIPGIDLIPASSNLVRLESWLVSQVKREHKISKIIEPLKSKYDVIVIDNNPSWSQLSINALFACDLNIASIGIDSNTIEALPQFFETIEYAEIDLADQVLLCGHDESTSLKSEIRDTIEGEYEGFVCKNTIRKSVKVDEANLNHLPVILYEPKNQASDDFKKVTAEIWVRAIKAANKIKLDC